jgi:hypothetical protein
MTRAFALVGTSILALIASTGAVADRSGSELRQAPVRQIRGLSLEFVGQFQNSAPGVMPPTHVHYGYLSYIRGLTVFTGATQNETTALFTFSADAATPRVIANGPLRIVTRLGRFTIYRDPSPDGDFGRPASFRDGTPVLLAQFRQQVVTDTVTGRSDVPDVLQRPRHHAGPAVGLHRRLRRERMRKGVAAAWPPLPSITR